MKEVAATEDYKLRLVFDNGEQGFYDCSDLLDFGVLLEFRDKKYFKKAAVLDGTVVWPNERDICPDTLYLDSVRGG